MRFQLIYHDCLILEDIFRSHQHSKGQSNQLVSTNHIFFLIHSFLDYHFILVSKIKFHLRNRVKKVRSCRNQKLKDSPLQVLSPHKSYKHAEKNLKQSRMNICRCSGGCLLRRRWEDKEIMGERQQQQPWPVHNRSPFSSPRNSQFGEDMSG